MSKSIKVSFQGIPGAYSEQAINEFAEFHSFECETVPTANFRALFSSIENDTHLGMVPIENSTAGSVVQCFDLFYEHPDLEIIGEYRLDVNHCLLTNQGVKLDQVTRVFSHPQALDQCSRYIAEYDLEATPFFDTAGAARELSENPDKTAAVIASRLSASYYNLDVVLDEFQNNHDNVTRFFLVKKKGATFPFESSLGKPNKSSVIFSGRAIPADLYKCLGGFATNGVNLLKLESRPKPGTQFEYMFYLDFEGTLSDKNVGLALHELEFFSEHVTVLGTYSSAQTPPPASEGEVHETI